MYKKFSLKLNPAKNMAKIVMKLYAVTKNQLIVVSALYHDSLLLVYSDDSHPCVG